MPKRYQSRSYWRLLLPLLLVGVYLGGGCTELRKSISGWITETFGEPTPREHYASHQKRTGGLDRDLIARWDSVYRVALSDTLFAPLPHREIIAADSVLELGVYTLRLQLPPGRILHVEAELMKGGLLFGELHHREPGKRPLLTWDTTTNRLSYENPGPRAKELLLLVQAAPLRPSRYDLRITTAPAIRFPVAGKDESAIQSFWGAARDGGRRRHEGNDIFAPRRTPLIAVADGRVRSVRDGGLGGKTIWLRDAEQRNLTYYYAHLDEQLVERGQFVQRGDTIGLVGNTGNASTTPPHLHFGIYADGAHDPFPYLRSADHLPPLPATPPPPSKTTPRRGQHFLRSAPIRKANVIRQLVPEETVEIMGASKRFFRVRTLGGESGYVNFD